VLFTAVGSAGSAGSAEYLSSKDSAGSDDSVDFNGFDALSLIALIDASAQVDGWFRINPWAGTIVVRLSVSVRLGARRFVQVAPTLAPGDLIFVREENPQGSGSSAPVTSTLSLSILRIPR
jgi:hypothetical protein